MQGRTLRAVGSAAHSEEAEGRGTRGRRLAPRRAAALAPRRRAGRALSPRRLSDGATPMVSRASDARRVSRCSERHAWRAGVRARAAPAHAVARSSRGAPGSQYRAGGRGAQSAARAGMRR